MNYISIASIPPLISSIFFLLIGVFVYTNNKKSPTNKSFFVLCFTTFIWQFTMFVLFNTKSAELAQYLVRLAHVGIILLPVALYHFVLNLIGRKSSIDKMFLRINYAAATIFELFLFTNYFINGYYEYFWSFYPKAGILHPFYLLLLFTTAIRLIYVMAVRMKDKKKTSNERYYQLKYIFWGTLFYLFASFDFLLNYGFELYPVGFLFILVFIVITSYAIVVHRLMDLIIILRRSSVYLLSFSTIILLAFFFSHLVSFIEGYDAFSNVFIILLLVTLFPYIKKYFYQVCNKYFFTSLYDETKVINSLSYNLRSTLDLNHIYHYLYETIDSSFRSSAIGFLAFDKKENKYVFKYKRGHFPKDLNKFSGNLDLHQTHIRKNKIIVVSELLKNNNPKFDRILNEFKSAGIEILVPINFKWKNMGLVALGKKATRDIYSKEDLETLQIIGGLVASAIQNGILFKESNLKNQELERALSAKSDFFRIANHQLNTPLSIMRLAYSSVDEKSLSLNKGFSMAKEGLNRLIEVITQLWTMSELETNNFKLKTEEVDLMSIFKEVIEKKKLQINYKTKNLKFVIKCAKKAKGVMVVTNEQKIKEVFSGLIENAISYTDKGEISVYIDKVTEEGKEYIKTTTTDTGVGISKEDQEIIYSKFVRGREAPLMQPDGSGVGLFIAKHIIEASGGDLKLEKTSATSGSSFSFTLPTF